MIFTVIPVKPFNESKTRLSSVLTAQQRVRLSQSLLTRTILTATQLSQVVVVSRSAAVRRVAKRLGAYALVEGRPDLNAAINQGIVWGRAQGGTGVLILPLDLPFLSTAALEALMALGLQGSPNIIIAPCRRRTGTNALFLSPPTLLSPQFGPDSFAKHQELARRVGVMPHIYDAPELAFDLDTPADWRVLAASPASTSFWERTPEGLKG